MKTKTIYISFLGIDERSRSAYEIFFKQMKHLHCVLTNDVHQAQICLVDMDAFNVKADYKALIDKRPELIMLVLSLSFYECHLKTEFFIRKPVKGNTLEDAINQISQQHLQIPVLNQVKPLTTDSTTTPKAISNKTLKHFSIPRARVNQTKKADVIPIKVNKRDKKSHSTASAARLLKLDNEEHFVGNQRDINVNNSEQLNNIYYSLENSLQNIVKKACIQSEQSGQIIQVKVLNHDFYFDHQEQKVYTSVGPGIIRPLCLLTLDKKIQYIRRTNTFRDELHEIIQRNKNKNLKKNLEKQSWGMEAFIWLISLWTSRGRIPEGTEILQPASLLQWPNLPRLASIPHSVRIAALLYDQPYPLVDAARALGIEQRYVFAFYAACQAIGLANMSQQQVNQLITPKQQKANKNKSILSKLLNKLKRFSEKSINIA